mgnify:CR=1 FL=1
MKLAIHNWMRAESIEQTIDRIARIGYEYLEIQGTPESYDTKKVKKVLDDAGVKCWGSVARAECQHVGAGARPPSDQMLVAVELVGPSP